MATIRLRRKPGDVRIETQRPTTSRSVRSPRYDAMAEGLPQGALIPVAFAPVLAGDTLKHSSMMARILAAPVEGTSTRAIRGAWFESWLFYVRVGDLPSAETIRSIIIDPTTAAPPIEWREECMQAIWRAYFADEGIDGTFAPAWITDENQALNAENFLAIPGNGWWDSVVPNADLPPVDSAEGDVWQEQWIRYQALRRAKLTVSTWEEYLAKNGVSVPPQLRVDADPDMKIPELLRWTREFAYPQPAGFGTSGVEQFRIQWFIQQKLEKGRFCAEPGFLVSCVAMRPKMYRDWGGTDVFDSLEVLDDASGWLPNDFDTDPHASLISVPAAIFGDTVEGAELTLDIRDVFLYGDQVTNVPLGTDGTDGVTVLTQADRYDAAWMDFGKFAAELQVRHTISSRIGTDTTAG